MTQSKNRGNTTERGLSLRSIVVVIPVTLVTSNITDIVIIIIYNNVVIVPAAGMRLEVFTRLEKVGELRGTGEAITLAAMSVM